MDQYLFIIFSILASLIMFITWQYNREKSRRILVEGLVKAYKNLVETLLDAKTDSDAIHLRNLYRIRKYLKENDECSNIDSAIKINRKNADEVYLLVTKQLEELKKIDDGSLL